MKLIVSVKQKFINALKPVHKNTMKEYKIESCTTDPRNTVKVLMTHKYTATSKTTSQPIILDIEVMISRCFVVNDFYRISSSFFV